MMKRTLISLILCLTVSLQGVPVAFANNQKLIAVRKAYYTSTGKKWDDATPREKRLFLKRLSTRDSRDVRSEEKAKRLEDREERMQTRKRDKEYSLLQRNQRLRERQKQIEERNWLREKKIREREMEQAKKKLKKARAKANAQKNR